MRGNFRLVSLVLTLALSAFALNGRAGVAVVYGDCNVVCRNLAAHSIITVTTYTTEAQCCNGTDNPCPDGYTPGGRSFIPSGGVAKRCLPSP